MKNKGVWYAVFCYAIWGVFPIYWKALETLPAVQIVAHRLVWSLIFLMLVFLIGRQGRKLVASLNRRVLLLYFLAGVLLTINWSIYIYGVNSGFVVETSLGYFINPLVSVIFGVIFLGERLPISKWIPIGLAAVGVAYLAIHYGQLPWIALGLAFSFGLYGLVKKLSPLGALHGLVLETAGMFLPALAFLIVSEVRGTGAFGHLPALTTALVVLAGPVTAIPLLLFASAARRIPLSMIGILQYIAPTLQFLLGVFAYGEPFTHDRLIGFSIIWAALVLFSLSGLYQRRKALAAA